MPRAVSSVVRVLEDLARVFQGLSVQWYLFGAQALVLRGCPRATADVDVTVLLGAVTTARLVTVLERAGFSLRIPDEGFVEATQVLPVVHNRTAMPVDIVLGMAGLEELFAASAQPQRIGRTNVPVPTSTHLVLMKVIAGRPKDLEDAARLLAARHNDIDASELDDLARAMVSALAEDSILVQLADARKRALRLVGSKPSIPAKKTRSVRAAARKHSKPRD
jgi:hypothetical protein